MRGDIPTALALKLHNTLMESVMKSISVQLPFLKKHVLPIILCLCELLNECNVFWDGMAPVHSLSEMEELRELVLKALGCEIKICLEILKTNPALAIGVEWLLKRLKGEFGNYSFVSVLKFMIITDLKVVNQNTVILQCPVCKINVICNGKVLRHNIIALETSL